MATPHSLTGLPGEILDTIMDHLNHYVYLNKLSQTCKLFHDLLHHDEVWSKRYREAFFRFEPFTGWIASTKTKIQHKHPEFPRNKAILRTVGTFDAGKTTLRSVDFVLVKGYLPCYSCFKFKPEKDIVAWQRTGTQALKGYWPYREPRRPRVCHYCLMVDRERAAKEIEETGQLTYKLSVWDRGVFACRNPFGLTGWRLAACSRCKSTSYCPDKPSDDQQDRRLCTPCYTGLPAKPMQVVLRPEANELHNRVRGCACGCGYSYPYKYRPIHLRARRQGESRRLAHQQRKEDHARSQLREKSILTRSYRDTTSIPAPVLAWFDDEAVLRRTRVVADLEAIINGLRPATRVVFRRILKELGITASS
ncbi:hypothetical protein PMZ80_005832 [Knufia obscura]|uniref:F-box domain-containing protein n=2 Tax=Knufia TaxID=430999 RepID=A0AAN8I9L3_9EURO|nr:hypothetical protein PMZ80_005832 [Knufia obscura]KAK5954500.1 hypothetical protein OHC33_004222 [Knufia fluminis]